MCIMCITSMSDALRIQKRLLDPLELEGTLWCWELNLGHLQEQQVRLDADQSLQPLGRLSRVNWYRKT